MNPPPHHRLALACTPMNPRSLFQRFAVSPLPLPAAWYAIPLRLIVGYGFFAHGYAKLARGPDNFASILHAMGLPFPDLLSWATVIVELAGGVMILLGALVPLVTVPMIVVLLVAIFHVNTERGAACPSDAEVSCLAPAPF